MKKIVPFNNVLNFNTDVYEITAISLEHDIKTNKDTISGTFYLSGEYKKTAGGLSNDTFKFELPFDIALGCTYKEDTMVIDIDDFRYELIDNKDLKVNIDLYIDGEEIEDVTDEGNNITKIDTKEEDLPRDDENLLDDMLSSNNLDNKEETNITNNNIFNNLNEEDTYVTYRVYRVLENDTLEKILNNYDITKEELAKYNNNLDIKPGDKLIIPANDK